MGLGQGPAARLGQGPQRCRLCALHPPRHPSPQIFDVQWSAADPASFATCGVKHIKFWTLSGNMLVARRGVFGAAGELQTLLCLAFGAKDAYTGTLSGDVYRWSGNTLAGTVPAAHKGAIYALFACPDGFASGGKVLDADGSGDDRHVRRTAWCGCGTAPLRPSRPSI